METLKKKVYWDTKMRKGGLGKELWRIIVMYNTGSEGYAVWAVAGDCVE